MFELMIYYSSSYHKQSPHKIIYPCFVLYKDNWDDYGFKTTYQIDYYHSLGKVEEIGGIKILDKNSQSTILPDSFTALDENKCSLGQSLEYYENVKRLFPESFKQIFTSLRDVAIHDDIASEFGATEGFRNSILRFGSADKAFRDAKLLLYHNLRRETEELYFTYSSKIKEASEAHVVSFDFKKNEEMPFRINVIIGKNGTGKTQFLGSLVNAISGVEDKRNFVPFIPLFNRVIAISYSLFDDFPKPEETTIFSYKYIGLRSSKEEIVSDEKLGQKLQAAFKLILKNEREHEWYSIIDRIIPLEQLGLKSPWDIDTNWITNISYEQTKRLSSGQSIVLFILTELIAHILEESLILFDEPETHLHPTAIAQLMNCFSDILNTYKSFAIMSTHSPIIIQDVPSKYISVFERIGNLPIIKKLPLESFGENLSVLTNTVFETNDIEELFKKHFKKLEENFYAEERINAIFNNKLSFNAQIYLAALFAKNNEKP
jgi:predicted ATPase